MSDPHISIRPHTPGDEAFIFATWLRSYRHSSDFAKPISNSVFFPLHHAVIQRILDRSSTRVSVACSSSSPDTVLGYLVTEDFVRPVIHFAYVKRDFRRQGILTLLLKEAGLEPNRCFYTHRTHTASHFEKLYPGLSYNPYLI
jgi:hypothetical protein